MRVVDRKTRPNKYKLAQVENTRLINMSTKFGNVWFTGSGVKCVLVWGLGVYQVL